MVCYSFNLRFWCKTFCLASQSHPQNLMWIIKGLLTEIILTFYELMLNVAWLMSMMHNFAIVLRFQSETINHIWANYRDLEIHNLLLWTLFDTSQLIIFGCVVTCCLENSLKLFLSLIMMLWLSMFKLNHWFWLWCPILQLQVQLQQPSCNHPACLDEV